MSKIRMGIIGCGSMNTNHERGLLDLADDVQVTCTCDIDRERAQRSAEHVHAESVMLRTIVLQHPAYCLRKKSYHPR